MYVHECLSHIVSEPLTLALSVIVETLLPLLSNTTHTRRQVVAQLVAMGLVDSVNDLKKQRSVSVPYVLFHSCDVFTIILQFRK